MSLKLIVGLGNPGPQYAETRHNIGAVWVRNLARSFSIPLALDSRFKGELGRGSVCDVDLRLLLPSTFMNLSGESVGAVAHFYKIDVDEILIAYDEMAFDPGVFRLKTGGGDNGHNGIKSVRAALANNPAFHRLRIGVGHPGDKAAVTSYLTRVKMPRQERELIEQAGCFTNALLSDMVRGNWQAAMNELHTT